MKRAFFLETERLGFSKWTGRDGELAECLWGDPEVTRYICARGTFSPAEVAARLEAEVRSEAECGVQYWPLFARATGEFLGCCGLRPHGGRVYEIGFHLRPEHWGRGYAREAAEAVMAFAFRTLGAEGLFAGHNPRNAASRRLLGRLGFVYTGDEYYAPTGLYHPSYALSREQWLARRSAGPCGRGSE